MPLWRNPTPSRRQISQDSYVPRLHKKLSYSENDSPGAAQPAVARCLEHPRMVHATSLLDQSQSVVQRLDRVYPVAFRRHRNCQDADSVIVRQCERVSIGWQVNRIGKQVGISVRLIGASFVVSMGGKPGHVSAFDEAGLQAHHLRVFIDARARRSRRQGRGSRSLRNWLLFPSPDPVIPLANETSPFLNCQLDRLVAGVKGGDLIAAG